MIRKILQLKLELLARLYLWRYKPEIIGVTGNAGKTSTKEAISAVLSATRRVRVASGNLNNEFGIPLAILGGFDREYYEDGPSIGFWIKVVILGFLKIILDLRNPELLILEYGADQPGDIKRLVSKYKPHISVITAVGDVPVHIEFFKDAEVVAQEKSNLVKVLEAQDYAVLNHDDDRVLDMKQRTRAHIMTYGFDEESDIHVSGFDLISNEEGAPVGATFKLHNGQTFLPVTITGSLGKSQAWAAAAAAAVGIIYGMNLVDISEALSHYHGPKGRLNILKGIKKSHVIDDTYNASPASMRLALETLRDLPGLRKVAILGDMLELGDHTIPAHQAAGTFAAEFVNILVCIGSRAKFIAEAAMDQLPQENIFTFDTSEEAKLKVQELLKERDLILVKGSQGIRMEKIVAEIIAEPQKAKNFLVRQSKKWLAK